ncbi:hypothetical protein Tco_0484932 [Tanacetum coccineum]
MDRMLEIKMGAETGKKQNEHLFSENTNRLRPVEEYDLRRNGLKIASGNDSMRIKEVPKETGRKLKLLGILQESVEQKKITGGGMDGILEIKMGIEKLTRKEEFPIVIGSNTQLKKKKDDLEVISKQMESSSKKSRRDSNQVNEESQTTELDTCDSNISTEPSELVSEPVVNESNIEVQPKVWSDAPIIEEYESDSDDEYVSVQTKGLDTPSFANKQVKTPRENVKNQSTHSQKPKVNNKELGHGFTERACFVCGSFSHLIRDCDYHVKLAKQVELNKQNMSKGNGTGERKPTWNNVQRVNKQNQFVPLAVQTRTGNNPVNTAKASSTNNFSTARQNVNRQTVLTSTALKVNTVKPIVNGVRPANVFHKTHSPSSRPFKRTTVLRTNFSNQKVYTAKENPHRTLKNKGIIDSGCSRHMTGNKAYLADFQDFNGGPVAFGGSKGYITGKGKIKTGKLDFEDGSRGNTAMPELHNKMELLRERTGPLFEATRTMLGNSFYLKTLFGLKQLVLLAISENQAKFLQVNRSNQHTGSKVKTDAGDLKKRDEFDQDCFEMPIWNSYSSTNPYVSKSDKKIGSPRVAEQVFLDDLARLQRQEKEANDEAEAIRRILNQKLRTCSTSHANESLSLSETTNSQEDDNEIPPLEDIHEDTTDGDPKTAVQTRSKVNKSSEAHAFKLLKMKAGLMLCKKNCWHFEIQKVWILVDLPYGKKAIEGLGVMSLRALMRVDFQMIQCEEAHFLTSSLRYKSNRRLDDKDWAFLNDVTASRPDINVLQSVLVLAQHERYLEKTEGNVEFHEVIDFLRRSYIFHALTVSPVVSTTFVEQFWTSAKSKTINHVRHITAKVAGKSVSISEASIRTDLIFDDADGIDTLPNQAYLNALFSLWDKEGDLTGV